jgi:membrane peptidoglycan carboxypeptidase
LFQTYDEIPSLLVQALLLVENRELQEPDVAVTQNPVVDWSRSAKATLLYAGYKMGLGVPLEGGSTLATQLEKFRYAERGRTKSAGDKLRQIVSASLRVYRNGSDTRPERRQIILDYLNSVPLAAAPGYGEVYGLGNGLHAWFGIDLAEAQAILRDPKDEGRKQPVFKHILALICSARAPSFYLRTNRAALEARVGFYTKMLQDSGAITPRFGAGVRSARLQFVTRAGKSARVPYVERKATNTIRTQLLRTLGLKNLYTLDRLNLEVRTTLDMRLQNQVLEVFRNLKDPSFIDAHALRQPQLLARGDPRAITYSFTLFERTRLGNALRVQADTLEQPFDLNNGMKLELGSTAKLRTLAHYLELVGSLYKEFLRLDRDELSRLAADTTRDPITLWTAQVMRDNPDLPMSELLDRALNREYSGNPGEAFFTGGGRHVFSNFDASEDGRMFSLREGLQHSVNLVYIRLMRDLVQFHLARLPYDFNSIRNDLKNPQRQRMLEEIADKESRQALLQAYKRFHGMPAQNIAERIAGSPLTARRLAMFFISWSGNAGPEALSQWLRSQHHPVSPDDARRYLKAYDASRLNISDFGYLLDRHPLEVWCAGELLKQPDMSWDDLLAKSDSARRTAFRWLFQSRNVRAQDLRLRIRFEQDAFARMLPYWQRLGFPFDRMVPSLASAIGSSADRPAALAELMGIIMNDGVRLPTLNIQNLRFAAGTPYETVFDRSEVRGTRVMEPAVAVSLRTVLAAVVENGTASRLFRAAVTPDGMPVVIGGKTGSGDNRIARSKAVSRTGTFVFYIGDRYFGVITAHVSGSKAAEYGFTSSLAVTALKLLVPTIASLPEAQM